jgi:putative membrane protein
MKDARKFLDAAERAEIARAAAEAEGRTAAEIVCALATESGRYDRAESLVGLAGSLLALGVAHVVAAPPSSEPGTWTEAHLSLGWQSLAVVAGFTLASVLASYVHALRGLFTSSREMEEETLRAAGHVFVAERLASTRSRGGVLVYVSLFERRVVVLADKGVMEAVGEPFVRELRDLAVARLRAGRRKETFTDALRLAAERLAPVLPVAAGRADELPTQLRVFHPRP